MAKNSQATSKVSKEMTFDRHDQSNTRRALRCIRVMRSSTQSTCECQSSLIHHFLQTTSRTLHSTTEMLRFQSAVNDTSRNNVRKVRGRVYPVSWP